MMRRINSRKSSYFSLFSVTVALSILGQTCFAQNEIKAVAMSATVGAPPPVISLRDALETFPDRVNFEYQYLQNEFTTDTKPFTVERTLSEEYNVTIQTNDGLKHDDEENVSQVLMPFIKVGDGAPIKTVNEISKWCGAGEAPAMITFGIDSDGVPTEGNYSGEMVLVFEPASE